MKIKLRSGVATTNVTPDKSSFLQGYPFVERMSTGVHDWLLCSALYLSNGAEEVLFISNDILYISKESVKRIRQEINKKTNIPSSHIMIGATHTHSGPVTVNLWTESDSPLVPQADTDYVRFFEDQIILAACNASINAVPAEIAFTRINGEGVGTNRRDPKGLSIRDIPVLAIRKPDGEYMAFLMVCSMHPTVLHEDSTLISGDFPAQVREILQKKYLMSECPVIYYTGAAGDQSPRHVTQSNTFEEAYRIGAILADQIGEKIKGELVFSDTLSIACRQTFVELPKRKLPEIEWANTNREKALAKLNFLRENSNDAREIRTAEVDWFGSEELLHLAKMAHTPELEKIYQQCMPAEVQILQIGEYAFVAWPGEIFVAYALALKERNENTFLITLTNGELQGYIVTEEAERNHYYEASNSLFHYSSGELLVKETENLLDTL